jgi:hypothetical protein
MYALALDVMELLNFYWHSSRWPGGIGLKSGSKDTK